MAGVRIRRAHPADAPLLLDVLVLAADWRGAGALTRTGVASDPALAHYVADWPWPDDVGVVATAGERPVGAAWARRLPAEDPGYGHVAPDVAEVTVGVQPAHRGRGIGRLLLEALAREARAQGHRRLSLSVEDDNRAGGLYRRLGFVTVARGGGATTMALDLTEGGDGR